MAGTPKYGRRHFFKDSALSFVKTAQEFLKNRDAPPTPAPPVQRQDWLRPPGAVDETLFLERCTRCNDCVKACPYGSITFDPRDGSPVIFPDKIPCYLCEDFPCIAACATDALVPVGEREEVRMGLAVVSHGDCTAAQGCNACVSQCPTRALGMNFDAMRLSVAESKCVGCGVCEQVCKTVNDTIAIRVIPARMLSAGPS